MKLRFSNRWSEATVELPAELEVVDAFLRRKQDGYDRLRKEHSLRVVSLNASMHGDGLNHFLYCGPVLCACCSENPLTMVERSEIINMVE